MSGVPNKQIEAWEDEGGAAPRLDPTLTSLRGTENQVEWALRIKRQVNEEFDRVAAAFRVVAHRQSGGRRTETETIIAVLEEKRSEVMSREDAGYFIRSWQEIGDQVRQLIFQDARYQAIKTNWPSR
jgi:Fe-S cluster assembly ATPase SufC